MSWPPSPCWCVMWSTSSPACGHLCVFFGKLAAQAFCPVSGWAARFLGPELRERLCVWRLAPRWLCRSEVCSPVQGVLLVVSPVVRKLLITPRLLLHLFPLPSELIQENVSCGLCASVPPMFSSSSLMVSGLTFRSLTHFGFIFVYGVRRCSGFIVFHGAVQLSQRQGPGSRGGAGRACVCVCARACVLGGCLCSACVSGKPGQVSSAFRDSRLTCPVGRARLTCLRAACSGAPWNVSCLSRSVPEKASSLRVS